MKLLVDYIDSEELVRMKMLLDEKGIPVYITDGRTVPGLWICLDNQFEDAKAVLSNPSCDVSDPVNVEEYYQMLTDSQKDQIASMGIDSNKMLNYVFGALALGLLIFIGTKFI